ncbi:glucose-6-phosphate isomerase [Bythopirellula polymerisocia]|uniref:Glucose-6-phosphate isomerase n=1 Tax=Bythopirellula polymerisocia TaxID=2528003 RepID=A0A5C6CKQ0_9BACT|nr:glucose-6-phosphate isomerase [Bythopirellula polymerisocia]TWU24635.1 Glucose-6-phosphate isomerase [Bythopirellula polymerisocia]
MSAVTITYDPQGTYLPEHGLAPDELTKFSSQLTAARSEVLADAQLWADGVTPPSNKEPLDAGFHHLPERLLADYQSNGSESEVGRIIATANRLAAVVDRVVLLGIGGSYMGARALLESCCHPYYNELPRQLRDNRPRVSFEGNNVDNDSLQGLCDLLPSAMSNSDVADRWGIVVISKSGGTLETAAAFRILLNRLQKSLGANHTQLAELVVPVTGTSGKLFDLATELGCREIFPVPDGVGGRFSVLSAVGLLPAAIMGLDIVQLLEGAAAMNDHFRSEQVGKNVVLDYTGICHLMEKQRGCDIRLLSTWGKRLEALGLWYDQLLSESLGKRERGAMPLTVVNTRDLHSRGQQHQEGKRDKLITNIIVDEGTPTPIPIGTSEFNQDGLNELAEKTIPEVLAAATQGTNKAYRDDNRPTADLRLPAINEFVMGQLFQMFMLATVVEGRLVGTNPYGQPGVEAYKKNMNAILRGM